MFTALLDTCVLWPSLQRDFLLSPAIEGVYRPAWSSAILDELEYEEAAKLVRRGESEGVASSRGRSLVTQMRAAFDDAEIQGWEGLEGTYGLPDPNDEHVLAAAVMAGAGAIVTHNVRDFPPSKIPGGIEVIRPADFVANAVSLDPLRAREAVFFIVERSGRKGPRFTMDQLLDVLAKRYAMNEAVGLIRMVSD